MSATETSRILVSNISNSIVGLQQLYTETQPVERALKSSVQQLEQMQQEACRHRMAHHWSHSWLKALPSCCRRISFR